MQVVSAGQQVTATGREGVADGTSKWHVQAEGACARPRCERTDAHPWGTVGWN